MLEELLNQTIVLRPLVAEGAQGPVYGPPVTRRCRYESSNELVRTTGGDEVVSNGRLFLEPDVPVTPESLIEVAGQERTVITVETVHGQSAPHHLQVTLR